MSKYFSVSHSSASLAGRVAWEKLCLFLALAAVPAALPRDGGAASPAGTEVPECRALLLEVKENLGNARCKRFREWGMTFLLAAVGGASTEAVSEITVIIRFRTLL